MRTIRPRNFARGAGAAATAGALALGYAGSDPNTALALPDLAAHAPGEQCEHDAGWLHDDACKECPDSRCTCASLAQTTRRSHEVLFSIGLVPVPGVDQTWCGCPQPLLIPPPAVNH
jgi:hypothetical protein